MVAGGRVQTTMFTVLLLILNKKIRSAGIKSNVKKEIFVDRTVGIFIDLNFSQFFMLK